MAVMAWRRERFELFSKDALIVSPTGRRPSARPQRPDENPISYGLPIMCGLDHPGRGTNVRSSAASSAHCSAGGICGMRHFRVDPIIIIQIKYLIILILLSHYSASSGAL